MKTQHTPGPWYIDPTDVDGETVSASPCGSGVIAECTPSYSTLDPRNAKANARLISAAPDLLSALEALVEDCKEYVRDIGGCDHSVGICCCDQIRNIDLAVEAIAKAKGEK